MKAEEIIRIADERTSHLSSNDIETAHLCSLHAVVATLQETGITIDPIRQPDKELTARCYKNFKGYTVVSIPMGSREEQVKCHTPYIVQVRRQGGSRWETHIDTVIESNMTDCDSLCVCPSDGEDDAMYDVRILCAASSRWEEVQQEQKRRREFDWELQREHIEFCTGKCPLMKDGICGHSCRAFWAYHLEKLEKKIKERENQEL